MNPLLPEIPKLAPFRRTEAASFRCRRKSFRKALTIFFSLLTVLLFVVVYTTQHHGRKSEYETFCAESLDDNLLVLTHWDSAPPHSRWVTGYYTRDHFYETAKMYTDVAVRDGYFNEDVAMRMVLTCLMFDRRQEAEEWRSHITDDSLLGWCETAFSSDDRKAVILEFAEAVAETEITSLLEHAESPRQTAHRFYWSLFVSNAVVLGLYALTLIFGWPVLRFLLKNSPSPAPRAARLERTWRPARIWAALMQSEWTFLYSGTVLSALGGLTWLASEHGANSLAATASDWYWNIIGGLSESGLWNLFFVTIATGPVFLMVRWLTPGFHSTLRLFGVRRCPLQRGAFWHITITGLGMVFLMYLAFGYLLEYLNLEDPRDSWAHDDEALWEQILFGCVVAPFVEEFLFRGFLFGAWRNSWGAPAAALVSSFLFAIAHGYSLGGLLMVGCFGLLMCAFYHRTGTLLVPMAIHALTNLLLTL